MYITSTRMPHERQTLIAAAIANSTETHTFYEHQNRRAELPVIRLDIAVPVYRLTNYRTRTAQLKYIHDHNTATDFFSAGQENESAQQAQHDILTVFAKQGRAASVLPIMAELEHEEQREPLLITDAGIIVNGNRRLAAMRELFCERPTVFRHFSHVDCAVLPSSITPEDIREIEVRLQMRPETKLPYGWINESMAVRELIDGGRRPDYVADLMNKKPRDVERAVKALIEVDIYLKEWLRQPDEYQLVEDAEQFFNDLARALDGVEGDLLEAKRRIGWALVANSDNLGRRIYEFNFSFDKKTDEVVTALSDRLGIDLTPRHHVKESPIDNDELAVDIGDDEDDTEISLEAFVDTLDDISQRDTIVQELMDVCNTIREQDRQGAIGNQALNAVKDANSKLMSVDLSKADPNTYNAIDAQLATVKGRVDTLEKALAPYKTAHDGQC